MRENDLDFIHPGFELVSAVTIDWVVRLVLLETRAEKQGLCSSLEHL